MPTELSTLQHSSTAQVLLLVGLHLLFTLVLVALGSLGAATDQYISPSRVASGRARADYLWYVIVIDS